MIARISSPLEQLREHYTVVVVGSGYGGAIAASRLARAGQDVCLLERGREALPGEYPDTRTEGIREVQADSPAGHVGSRMSLFEVRSNPEMNVIVGCGLGGTSLVNANVSLRAEPRVFEDPRWPQAVRDDLDTLLAEGYARAEAMLRPVSYPSDGAPLRKLAALERSAAALGARFYRPPINVSFETGRNHVGVEQQACVLCGDCVSGCNYGAKNTVLMNYLPDAKAHGAEIYTGASVRRVERVGGRWRVHFQRVVTGREPLDSPTMSVTADVVVLGAGALGSTEILLRSKEAGLALSDRVGDAFTGNGDVLGFAYNSDVPVNAIGLGARPPAGREPVGPCITGIIDLREQPVLEDGIVIEEGVIPGAIADFLPVALATAHRMVGKDTDAGVVDLVAEINRELESLVKGPYHGALRHTQIYLVMAHDDGQGRIYLEDDRGRIDWPGVGSQKIFARIDEQLEAATGPLGGTYLRNPAWTKMMKHNLVTVHPLGGCVMGEDATNGVVDERGRVFAGEAGTATHQGLYVSDGSVVPRPLGVNPLLTISAISERCCTLIAADRGWHIDYSFGKRLAAPPPTPAEPQRLGVQLAERMRGHVSTDVSLDYEGAARVGQREGATFEASVAIVSDNLERLLEDPRHEARLGGTVTVPALSPEPFALEEGIFTLMASDPARPGLRETRYRGRLRGDNGVVLSFDGFKVIRDDRGFDSWADATTVFVTISDTDGAESRQLAKGVATMTPLDFMRSVRSIEITNAHSRQERLDATARFGSFCMGPMFEIYGPAFRWPTLVRPDAPPRKKRELRTSAPITHAIDTPDGAQLLLTRYEGGTRGPVVAAHGLGASSEVFAVDTLDTTLVEYLFANGFDVWLLDWRASCRLPSSTSAFTLDVVARNDWPSAVQAICERTGAPAVDAVLHSTGSLTFFMAMLSGLEGVRSAVSLQGGVHLVTPAGSPLHEGAHIRELASGRSDVIERIWERVGRLAGRGRDDCRDPICQRITYMYGPIFEHDRLDSATHDALHELVGVTSPTMFDHLGRIAAAGRLVDAAGADSYLPHVARLALPMMFIHGTADQVFLPEGTEQTVDLLSESNGRDLYRRRLVPGYGHLDALIGREAVSDVYPFILDHLERAPSMSRGAPQLAQSS
jgi:cholesterol oxidase